MEPFDTLGAGLWVPEYLVLGSENLSLQQSCGRVVTFISQGNSPVEKFGLDSCTIWGERLILAPGYRYLLEECGCQVLADKGKLVCSSGWKLDPESRHTFLRRKKNVLKQLGWCHFTTSFPSRGAVCFGFSLLCKDSVYCRDCCWLPDIP